MTPQTLTPAELDELERLRSDLNKNHHRACLCSLCVERYENYKVGVLAAAPALLAMARRLGELQYRWGEFSASNLANLHSLNAQLTAATARVAELDAALTTALADAEMAEHAHDACEEQLTAATARAEAEAMAFRIVADRITEIADDALGLQVPGTAPVAMLDALEKAYHGERVAKSTADARAQAAEKRCGEMEAKLAECSQGWRRTERGDGDVRLECLTCGTVEYDALPAKPGGGK